MKYQKKPPPLGQPPSHPMAMALAMAHGPWPMAQDFGDGTGAWRLQPDALTGLALELRGTRFVGTKESPMWQFPNGVRCLGEISITL